jgi:hypothetical protein
MSGRVQAGCGGGRFRDLGAYTAESPWVANQIGSNLAGVLLFVFAIGLWRSLGRHPSARIGSSLVALAGVCIFLTGFLRLDCREIDAGCGNSSWHAQSHLALAALTALVLVLAPFVVARGLKLTQNWRDLWVPTLAFAIGTVVAGVAGSAVGGGLGSLLAALVWFTWFAMLAVRMLRPTRAEGVGEPTPSTQATARRSKEFLSDALVVSGATVECLIAVDVLDDESSRHPRAPPNWLDL